MRFLRRFGLLTRTNLAILLILAVFFVLTVFFSYRQVRQLVMTESVEKARLISRQAVEMREYMSKNLRLGHVRLSDERYGLIPVVVSNRVGQVVGRDLGYTVHQVSERYRNPDNAPDPFERRLLERFDANPYLKEDYATVREGGRLVLRYMQPFRAEESCLHCHGRPEDAPAFIRARFPVEKDHAYNYHLGEIIGAVSMRLPMDRLQRQLTLELRGKLIYFGSVFLGLALCVGLLLRYGVLRPLQQLSATIDEVIRTGRFDRRLEPMAMDEVGQLVANFNRMAERVGESTQLLEESEHRFRALTEGARDGIIGFLADGKIILFNPSAERLFGYSRVEALGMDVARLIAPEFEELHQLGTAAYLEREAARLLQETITCSVLRRSGERFEVELSLSQAQSDGHPFYTAILRPTTEGPAES